MFDKYTLERGENSKVYTVDINPQSTKVCEEVVSKNVEITTEDSVRYLKKLTDIFLKNRTKVSMFYLDSFDVDWRYTHPAAAHHLKELTSLFPNLTRSTHNDGLYFAFIFSLIANLAAVSIESPMPIALQNLPEYPLETFSSKENSSLSDGNSLA